MAIGVYFHPQGMTKAQYEETLHKLTEAGAGTPPGRKYHACFGPDGQLMVFDIWDSVEEFQAFAQSTGARYNNSQWSSPSLLLIGRTKTDALRKKRQVSRKRRPPDTFYGRPGGTRRPVSRVST